MTHALPVHPTHLHPLTGQPLRALAIGRRGPIWPILGGDDTVPPVTTTPPAGAPADTPPPSGGAPAGGTAPPAGEPKKIELSQEKLDEIIRDRLAKQQTAFDAKLAEIQATAGKTELEAAQIERDRYKDQLTTTQQKAAEALAGTRGELAAHLAGAKPERIKNIVKEADLTAAIAEDGTVDEAAVKAAVEKVLTEFPEWKGTTVPASSGGELTPGGTVKPTYTRAQIAAETQALRSLPPEEAKKKLAELNAAAAEGRITG